MSDLSQSVSPIRRRTPPETIAYCQGYLAGLEAAHARPGNYLVFKDIHEELLEQAWRQYREASE